MKKQILEMLPKYLIENEYFVSLFEKLINGVSNISVGKHRNGNYYFTSIQEPLMDNVSFSLFVSNKGISDVTMQKIECLNSNSGLLESKSNILVSSIKTATDGYSITSRHIITTKDTENNSFEKRQFFEKREYDSNGVLLNKQCNSYIPEEIDYDSYRNVSWDNDASLERALSYVYSGDFAISREYNRILGSNTYLPQHDEKRYIINYKDGKEIEKKEIDEEEYQEIYYDIAYKNKTKSNVKKLEKRF